MNFKLVRQNYPYTANNNFFLAVSADQPPCIKAKSLLHSACKSICFGIAVVSVVSSHDIPYTAGKVLMMTDLHISSLLQQKLEINLKSEVTKLIKIE